MADFSNRDFIDFDGKRFWKKFEQLQAIHPEFGHYRNLFESSLKESITSSSTNAS
ncbi:hypothetical protein [Pseudanabaena sp. BC1403]|uniref:hypothetical protein n=1 Tax=Pseudanabaena sp. BC1403 TaxID=2043171 RepID=UPI0015E1A203|nr:hypothetical protein [Pseudanabaena sp. BC1403]